MGNYDIQQECGFKDGRLIRLFVFGDERGNICIMRDELGRKLWSERKICVWKMICFAMQEKMPK